MKGSLLMPMKQSCVEDDEDQRSLRARLKQALQEQEQTFVRIVEERRLQVGQIEAQLYLSRKYLAEAEAQLTSFRDRNSCTNYDGNASASLHGSELVKVTIVLDEGENNQEKDCFNDGVVIKEPVGLAPSDIQDGTFANESGASGSSKLHGSELVKVKIDLNEGENNQENDRFNDAVVIREPVGVAPSGIQDGIFANECPTMATTHDGDKFHISTSFSDPIAMHEDVNLLTVNSNGVVGANLLTVNSNGVSERAQTKEKASRAGKGAELGANMVAKFKHSRKGKPMHLLVRYNAQRLKFNLCVLPARFRHIVWRISNRMIKGLRWTNSALDCFHISTEDYLGFAVLQEDIHGLMSARWNWFHSASFMNGDLTLPPKTRLTKCVRVPIKYKGTKRKQEEVGKSR